MAAQFARGREFSEQDLFFTGASNAISLGVNSFVDSSITRGLVTDALDNGLQMAIYSTKSVDWGVMLAHAGGAYLGNKMHDGIAQQRAMRYSELHSYNVNTDAFLNPYTGSDLTVGGLMSRLDAEIPISIGFGGVREVVAANDSSFSSAVTRMYNKQLNSPGIMGSVARFDRGFGSALREGMVSVASSLLHPLDTLSSSLLFATDIADIPLELLGTMFSSDAKTRNLQRLDGIRDVGVGLISGDATQSGHAAGQLSSLVFSAYGVKMGGALSVDVLERAGVRSGRNVTFKSGGDRLFESMGPGRISHPEEFKNILSDVKAHGIKVDFSHGEYAYGAAKGGRGGNFKIDPDASISAVRHEYSHFLDDKALGFPGFGKYIEEPSLRLASERRAYLQEIKLAKIIDDQVARRQLILDYLEEKQYLIDRFYEHPYGYKQLMRPK